MPPVDILNNYRAAVVESNGYVQSAHLTDTMGRFLRTPNERSFVTESAFLKSFIAWEVFLESMFVAYLLGEPSIAGRTVVRHAVPTTPDHARNIIKGTQKYFDWTVPDKVVQLAQLYFDNGDPFRSVFSFVNQHLLDLKIVRNAAAHLSSTTSGPLDRLSNRKLGVPVTNTTAYAFLMATDPSSVTGDTVSAEFAALLDIAAEQIANA